MKQYKTEILVVLLCLLLVLTMGAGNSNSQIGRYQIAGTGNDCCFVIDTTTGVVKTVAKNAVTTTSGGRSPNQNIGRPFAKMKTNPY